MTLEQQMRTGLLVDAPVRHRSYRCRFVYVVVAHDGRAAERTYPGPEEPHHGCQTYRAHIVATRLQGRLHEQETQPHSSDMTEHIQSRAQYLSSRGGLLRLLEDEPTPALPDAPGWVLLRPELSLICGSRN